MRAVLSFWIAVVVVEPKRSARGFLRTPFSVCAQTFRRRLPTSDQLDRPWQGAGPGLVWTAYHPCSLSRGPDVVHRVGCCATSVVACSGGTSCPCVHRSQQDADRGAYQMHRQKCSVLVAPRF